MKGAVLEGLRKLLEACSLADLRESIERHEQLSASVRNEEMLERLSAEFNFHAPPAADSGVPATGGPPKAKRISFYTNVYSCSY